VEPVTQSVTKPLRNMVTQAVTQIVTLKPQSAENTKDISALPYNNKSIEEKSITPTSASDHSPDVDDEASVAPTGPVRVVDNDNIKQQAHNLLISTVLPREDIPGLIPVVVESLNARHTEK